MQPGMNLAELHKSTHTGCLPTLPHRLPACLASLAFPPCCLAQNTCAVSGESLTCFRCFGVPGRSVCRGAKANGEEEEEKLIAKVRQCFLNQTDAVTWILYTSFVLSAVWVVLVRSCDIHTCDWFLHLCVCCYFSTCRKLFDW